MEAYYQITCIGQLNITHTAADLTVTEDGLPVTGVTVYSPDTTQHSPMSVALVFDASGGSGGSYNPPMKIARITSYNVCYTKLLRYNGSSNRDLRILIAKKRCHSEHKFYQLK